MKDVLFVPAKKHQADLLREGPCGARPPRVRRWARRTGRSWSDLSAWTEQELPERGHWITLDGELAYEGPGGGLFGRMESALVLAWTGVSVPEGMDRACRALAQSEYGVWCPGHWMVGDDFGCTEDFVRLVTLHGTAGWRPGRAPQAAYDAGLHREWALATVCASKKLGTVETLPGGAS